MRRALLILLWVGAGLTAMVSAVAATFVLSGWESFGATPVSGRRVRIERSPQWVDGRFANPQRIWRDAASAWRRAIVEPKVVAQKPDTDISVLGRDAAIFDRPPSTGLRITWFGHSAALVEIDGKHVLIDPIWSDRASPVSWAGPKRWFRPPIALRDLPAIDAVIISHDHYDDLDRATIEALKGSRARFIVPLGIGAHFNAWGITDARITELDCWERARIGGVEIVATPARHASGRVSTSSNQTLWAGYAIVGPTHRVWYSGDTCFQPAFARIGRELGPFDVTLIEAGQYDPAWPDNHLGPEMAVAAHRLVRGKLLLPVHWGSFSLAPHGWTEPIERVLAAARCDRPMS